MVLQKEPGIADEIREMGGAAQSVWPAAAAEAFKLPNHVATEAQGAWKHVFLLPLAVDESMEDHDHILVRI